jgi:hypothetical protein
LYQYPGLTIGPSGVASLTQFVSRDPLSLRYSIAIVGLIAGVLAVTGIAIGFMRFPALNSLYALPDDPASVA